jgi:hypothetical protein
MDIKSLNNRRKRIRITIKETCVPHRAMIVLLPIICDQYSSFLRFPEYNAYAELGSQDG